MSIQPWKPTSFLRPRAEKELWNALISYANQPFKIPGTKAAVIFSVVEALRPDADVLLLSCRSPLSFVAQFEHFPFQAMLGVDLSVSQLATLPEGIRKPIYETLVSLAWSALPEHTLGNCQIEHYGRLEDVFPSAAEDLTWISLKIAGLTPEPILLTLGFPLGKVLPRLIKGTTIHSKHLWPALEEHLTFDAFFTLGSLLTSFNGFETLEPGDVMIFDSRVTEETRVRVGNVLYAFETRDEQMTCSRIESQK